ncbi:ankyrin repeat and BTB/POZ domain-containing protein 1-like isoform X1 [Dermatophagoides pteronyssinus]|uniref:ankyrin repeat and BTB/POZ domain-containing protein 1-like isoform X1 n=2 Tax=Dermatophagoides pteronyssinus TaxID=6956 RepID=UPI003F668E45
MDISRMFRACKLGDFQTLKTLIETKDVDVNFRDKFDSTPLYYACLCGHMEVVRFLLEHGAKCDVKTFDGERCVYGALTDDIRKLLLKEYNVINKKIIRRNDYDEFLRKLLNDTKYTDIIFKIHNNRYQFRAHRCILMIRSKYFYKKFLGKWKDKHIIQINNKQVNPDAFKILLQYLYTGIVEFSFRIRDDVCRLFRQCHLNKINEMIDCRIQELQKQRRSLSMFRNKNVTIFLDFPVSLDYRKLFQTTLPEEFSDPNDDNDIESMKQTITGDVVFQIENQQFNCHKLFFAIRSDYFVALFCDHFQESSNHRKIHTIDKINKFIINDRIDLFRLLTCFIYTNNIDNDITLDQVCDLLYASDVYLIESLKRHCATIIGANIGNFNPIDIIKWSRILNLPKLEAIATQYIANNLKNFINENDFKKLVIDDAQSVRQRQETDTIDIIDDIRYYLSINSTKKDLQYEFQQIDLLLQSLQLDA